MLDLMLLLDMPVPPHKREVEAMLITCTHRLTKDKVINKEQASIIDMTWRCLYAKIVRARVDGVARYPIAECEVEMH